MSELKAWHVGVMFAAFFGITIAVNIVLSVYAISTFSGEDVSSPYLRGLAYNKTLAARSAQAQVGWRAAVSAQRSGEHDAVIEVTLLDSKGQALSQLTGELTLRRPTDARLDRVEKLVSIGNGTYRVTLKDVTAGQWDVVVRAQSATHADFEAQRRVVLP